MLKLWYDRSDHLESSKTEVLACLDIISSLSSTGDEVDIDFNAKVVPIIEAKETIDDATMSEELSVEQKQQLGQLLFDVIQHTVKTKTNEPVYKKPYPLPYALRNQVKIEVEKMLKSGIIESSTSPYAAPVVLVKKKDSSIRFCVYYCSLNQVTFFDPRMMPRMDEILNKVSRSRYTSKIDLTKGYWQVPLDADVRRKSAFVTSFGHFQFTVMPFGMVNAGATFVRLMQKVLCGHEDYADSFINDVGIFSDSWSFHLEHLRLVFQLLREAKLTARPSKCLFVFSELEFLGNIAGNGTIKPVQDKVSAIREFPVPTTKKKSDRS
ncbi:unnamed protein product [Mytilus coruscus]|uniref:Reverse transcriptase domain-containing protein n=1 Tax=Mytilus coruscus TaxID=42192 RepID=A0A6J8CY54_MYTCO|nr:unnamed protein product [Mytilus coruscus]